MSDLSQALLALSSLPIITSGLRQEGIDPLPHKRRYLVAGIDQDGDVQAFASDDHAVALEVREQMEDDLIEVRMIGTQAQEAGDNG